MKVIRIILSPLVFLIVFMGMLVIPIGPLSLFMGLWSVIGKKLMNIKVSRDDILFMLSWPLLSLDSTMKFIDGDPSMLD
jgi:hypothetical protein